MILCGVCSLVTLTGCVGKSYTPSAVPKEAVVVHNYDIEIVDERNIPLEGATIDYTLTVPGYTDVTGTIVSGKEGRGHIKCETHSGAAVQPNGSIYHYAVNNSSSLKYNISKQYHFSSNDKINFACAEQTTKDSCIKKQRVVLYNYVSNDIAEPLKGKIQKIVSEIMLEAFLRDSLLAREPITLEKFKGNLYLNMNFKSLNTYNSTKLNKYDIGKILFDDVLRKILTHLDKRLWDSKDIYGYELTILAPSKNFIEKNSKEEQIEYKFFLPKKIVNQYKDMDISGQKLLDSSIILQNGERVDLKLQ